MKGLSPLVATVLLIVIVVSIATLVTGWVTTFTRQSQETATNRTTSAIDCSGASISIRSVFVTNGTAGSAAVLVENTGFVNDLTITAAQVLNRTGGNFSSSATPVSNFDRGDIATLRFSNVSIPLCPNDFSEVVVATNCGGISDRFKDAPKC